MDKCSSPAFGKGRATFLLFLFNENIDSERVGGGGECLSCLLYYWTGCSQLIKCLDKQTLWDIFMITAEIYLNSYIVRQIIREKFVSHSKNYASPKKIPNVVKITSFSPFFSMGLPPTLRVQHWLKLCEKDGRLATGSLSASRLRKVSIKLPTLTFSMSQILPLRHNTGNS